MAFFGTHSCNWWWIPLFTSVNLWRAHLESTYWNSDLTPMLLFVDQTVFYTFLQLKLCQYDDMALLYCNIVSCLCYHTPLQIQLVVVFHIPGEL